MAGSKTVGAGTSPLVSEVDQHEVRISNAENNIRALQTATNTPDNPSNAPVPVVNSTVATGGVTQSNSLNSAVVADTPEPVTVVAYKEIVIDADTSDCEYTYSDGTTHRFQWKTTNPQGSWVTDGSGNNGHWVKTTSMNGFCSEKALGQVK